MEDSIAPPGLRFLLRQAQPSVRGRRAHSVDKATMGHSSVGNQATEEAARALLALISAGDRCAMDNLYILYFARLANFFRNLTADADLAEELINDTMFELWIGGASIRANASISLAIMGLAYSRVKKHFTETNQPHIQPAMQEADHVTPTLTISDTPSNLRVFLSRLPVEERAVVHLVYASGHSRRDIGDIMNISCECVDVLLGNARLRLRRCFQSPDS
jgi:RNA polymerase sigma-70 factor, ECF subfamily